ncbi:periodic tryptophan protein 1 homolog [Dermacentor silvarum]|uniref:periodic tryptophan protein 1 homolog n=1 Tax=Dermacentor silvarum TaxID=543639 RepID=UPI00189B9B4B|nr:periodic tryptophan protein 1 homolog [Dermacentor silvarum]
MNFVPCVAWVPRGVAKANPEKVKLLSEQLKELIEKGQQKNDNKNVDGDGDLEDGNEGACEDDITAKYGLDTYDDEDSAAQMGNLAELAVYANNADDPYLDPQDGEDSEEEIDDFTIRSTDNLIAVARVDEDTCATIEVYVNNHQEEHLYVHHDIMLPAYPLCLEWMNFDPADANPGNYLAVGDMTPVISVWDLDLVDTLEPAYKLGKKAKKKKATGAKATMRHSDAVLSLSWNKQVRHLLASGSADNKALVWDLDTGIPARCLSAHKEKVQSVAWHPFESHTMLTGACDSTVKLWDCRNTDASFKSWTVDGEVEKVLWNHFDPFYFYVSTDSGFVYGFDARTDQAVFTLSAHSKGVTGMALSAYCPGCLVTASEDKTLKVWDVLDHKPVFLFEKEGLNVGSVLTLASSPDEPFVIAIGGDNKSLGFAVVDLKEWTALNCFEGRKLLRAEVQTDDMETDAPSGALGGLSLDN